MVGQHLLNPAYIADLGKEVQKPIAAAKSAASDDKVLHPKEFREFELEEKTVLSHNTAMYVLHRCSLLAANPAKLSYQAPEINRHPGSPYRPTYLACC